MNRGRLAGAGYFLAAAAAGLAFLLRWLAAPLLGRTAVYPLFVLAVLAATYAGGVGPGFLAAVLGFFLADYFFIPPLYSLGHFTETTAMDFAVYTFACLVTIALVESLRRVRRKLEADIRDRDLLQVQLHEAHTELERIVQRRTATLTDPVHELEMLSYSLSHDLRAPLRAMEGYARAVEIKCGPLLPAEGKDLLERIARSATRLDGLIKDVLTYHRTANEPVEVHAVNLERLLDEVIAARPELQAARDALEIRRPLEPVRGHEALLTQCLVNLLSNALRFVASGTPPHVCLWTQRLPMAGAAQPHVRLVVQDNGIGISPADQQKIWNIFIRLYPQRYEGTGIGLAIVRKAAERMGGSVGVESSPGQGSRFWLELPAP